MRLQGGFATDVGRKRSQNQDSTVFMPEIGLFIVADGMGGHQGGEIASSMVVNIAPPIICKYQEHSNWSPREALIEALSTANKAIFDHASKNQKLQGMGTTTTALLFKEDILAIGQVGDSRCYFFLPHSIWQLTRDHSLVQEKLKAGLISRAELKTDRMKNVITRSVGFEPIVNIDIYEIQVSPGNIFLACSDGLSGLVEDHQMLEIVQRSIFEEHEINQTAQRLIEAANQNGGDDNITTILVEVLSESG